MIDASLFVESLNDRYVAVFGLGRSGLATIEALVKAGAKVLAWDDRVVAREKALDMGAVLVELNEENLKGCAYLILAPGVPFHFPEPHAVVHGARAAGIPIISDVELLHLCGHGRKTIGITGTNGKSTTTAILHHVLKEGGVSVACGGNIGMPVMSLDMPADDGIFVLELSSFQLDLCPSFAPDIAVLLNITPDHLDRHGDMDGYVRSKMHIFDGAALAVVGAQTQAYPIVASSFPFMEGADFVSIDLKTSGANIRHNIEVQGRLIKSHVDVIADLSDVEALSGDHNMQNAAAALSVALELGLNPGAIEAALQTYPGLVHRQYPVKRIDGVLYVNDSKATNSVSTSKALVSYEDIFWIAGGQSQGLSLDELQPFVSNVRHAFLIGEAQDILSEALARWSVPYTKCDVLDQAVQSAHHAAQKFGASVVLLSPACKSFDQFTSFEARGDAFTDLVERVS